MMKNEEMSAGSSSKRYQPSKHYQKQQHDKQIQPDLFKTRMCPNATGFVFACPLAADDCRFAHSPEELRIQYDRYYKVQPCAFFTKGKCRNGGKLFFCALHFLLHNIFCTISIQISVASPTVTAN